MIKLLTIGLLIFLLYRVVVRPNTLKEAPKNEKKEIDEGEFIDYEEVD